MTDPVQQIKDALEKYPSGWENLTESWVLDETNEDFVEAQAVVGAVTQEDFRAGVIFVDTGNYYQPKHAKPIANFIAACNATAIRTLLERLEAAEKDAARLDFIEKEVFELTTRSTSEDDYVWEIAEYHMAAPNRRVIDIGNSVRSAIDAVMEQTK